GGLFNRETLDGDVERLTAYYRGLGFFRARVGREIDVRPDPFDSNREWVAVTFVIDEGPRYRIRNLAFFGNEKIPLEKLQEDLELKSGDYFDQNKLQLDMARLQDKYGAIGHVFADVEVDPRFLEEPGMLDLVYRIDEGRQYQVGRINVKIQGEFPHTRVTTVLNRMSLAPTDIVDTRELRASERRMRSSQIFEVDPTRGVQPKIVFSPPELTDPDTGRPGRRPVLAGEGHPRPQRPPDAAAPPETQRDGVVPTAGEETPSTAEPTIYRGQYGPAAGTSLPSPPSWMGRILPRRKSAEEANAAEEAVYDAPYQTADGAFYDAPPQTAEDAIRDAPPQTQEAMQVQGAARAAQPAVYTAPAGAGWSPRRPEAIPASAVAPIAPAAPATYAAAPAAGTAGSSGVVYPAGAIAPDPSGAVYAASPSGPVYPAQDTAAGPVPAQAAPIVFPDRPPPGQWDGYWSGGEPSAEPPLDLPLEPIVTETRTGRLLFSVGVNSDAGLLGTVLIEEQNFDIARLPRSWRDIADGVAWRGAGQRFRLEAVPGTEVQRYSISFADPYFLDRNVSLSVSGYYYRRDYREWNEERLGGRIGFGYQFTPDLSGTIAYRGADIKISDPIVTPFGTPQDLLDAVGTNLLHGFEVALTHDTRDNSFLPTEGHLFQVSFEQVVGTYDYPRAEIDLRKYFLLSQRPDGSGRHVLGVSTRFDVTGDDTPIYDHYFAGGYSSLRGFDFRGASPHEMGIPIGGHMMFLASAEYIFPITADDMIRGVIFCDTGTVERTVDSWDENYRVAPGFGLRVVIPAMGPAPIALDFAFPVSKEETDDEQVFSFFIGFLR
ncbi:MAG: BamA/TamA family outer membrane protein, partial [Thermogutta sp.]|nr:BamA/TamA family outer membrane protein [Thermogutta sp.]